MGGSAGGVRIDPLAILARAGIVSEMAGLFGISKPQHNFSRLQAQKIKSQTIQLLIFRNSRYDVACAGLNHWLRLRGPTAWSRTGPAGAPGGGHPPHAGF